MKLITRSAIAVVFLIGFATPLLAQRPDVAIRINKPAGKCFPVTVKNLRTNVVSVSAAVMRIFDKNCKQVCVAKVPVNKRLLPCQSLDFRICCEGALPASYICYVLVVHSNGRNEEWFFRP